MTGLNTFKIIIVGGGIAGLAAAIGLRGPNQHREIGAAISLQPNTSKIVEKWGISSILEKKGATIDRGFRIYSPNGILRTTVLFAKEMFGANRMLYHRVDLLEGLKDAATSPHFPGPPVEIRLSNHAISCDCKLGVVAVKDGSTVEGDLVVAADGIHSALRKDIIGQDQQPVPTGLSAYRIMMSSEFIEDIPEAIKDLLKAAPSLRLWQLRDIDQLKTWDKGRCNWRCSTCYVAASRLGVSQSIEDAEALQTIFSNVEGCPSKEEIERRLQEVFECRYERASLIQRFTRQQAKHASNIEGNRITMDATEFMEYNCRYEGARAWQAQQRDGQ
ncbi:FAD/NAD(P)-binding domain-containing protein [Acephala macrosclerotiorum]|nr:FAD/NAD(P)-binding domain-containing protein [Acephala macrosclerotiorum]